MFLTNHTRILNTVLVLSGNVVFSLSTHFHLFRHDEFVAFSQVERGAASKPSALMCSHFVFQLSFRAEQKIYNLIFCYGGAHLAHKRYLRALFSKFSIPHFMYSCSFTTTNCHRYTETLRTVREARPTLHYMLPALKMLRATVRAMLHAKK